jgi:hypothetical protein
MLLACATALLWAGGYPVKQTAKKVVSEIKTCNWDPAKGWFEGETTKIIVESYDEKGRLVTEELYIQKMTLIEKTLIVYEGAVVKKTTTNHENKVIRTASVQRTVNTLTETVFRGNGTLLFTFVSLLDNKERVTELRHCNGAGDLVFRKVYGYLDNGELEDISLYNASGTLAVVINFSYASFDAKGNWLARSEYYSYADVRRRPRDIVRRTIEY